MAVQPAEFGVAVTTEAGLALVKVRGELDAYTAPRLREELIALIGGPAAGVVVDMSATTFVDATGLATLAYAARRLQDRANDGELVVRSPTRATLKLMEMTGLAKIITVT